MGSLEVDKVGNRRDQVEVKKYWEKWVKLGAILGVGWEPSVMDSLWNLWE